MERNVNKGVCKGLVISFQSIMKKSKPSTARQLLDSGIVGMWRERRIDDSAVYARTLREKAQRRDR
jgi:hypothetical protein